MAERVYEVKCLCCKGVFAAGLSESGLLGGQEQYTLCPWCEEPTQVTMMNSRPVRTSLQPRELQIHIERAA